MTSTDQTRRPVSSIRRIAIGAAGFSALLLSACATGPATTGERSAPAAAAAKAVPAKPVFARADVIGKSAKEIDERLGPPQLTRIEGPGEYRRYALAACNLVVILYPEEQAGPGREARSTHVEAAAKRANDPRPDLDACLAAGKPVEG